MSKGFQASKYFQTMQEVEHFLESLKDQTTKEEYEAFKSALGLAEQKGEYLEVEGIGKIDKSIAGLIQALNKRGYRTLSSCSGLMHEHPHATERLTGYLSFLRDKEGEKILEICSALNLPVTEGEVYLQPALTVRLDGNTDNEVEEKWNRLCVGLLECHLKFEDKEG